MRVKRIIELEARVAQLQVTRASYGGVLSDEDRAAMRAAYGAQRHVEPPRSWHPGYEDNRHHKHVGDAGWRTHDGSVRCLICGEMFDPPDGVALTSMAHPGGCSECGEPFPSDCTCGPAPNPPAGGMG